jgi:hypothetical protein
VRTIYTANNIHTHFIVRLQFHNYHTWPNVNVLSIGNQLSISPATCFPLEIQSGLILVRVHLHHTSSHLQLTINVQWLVMRPRKTNYCVRSMIVTSLCGSSLVTQSLWTVARRHGNWTQPAHECHVQLKVPRAPTLVQYQRLITRKSTDHQPSIVLSSENAVGAHVMLCAPTSYHQQSGSWSSIMSVQWLVMQSTNTKCRWSSMTVASLCGSSIMQSLWAVARRRGHWS